MSMYTQLLGTALDRTGSHEQISAGEALAELLHASGRLAARPRSSPGEEGWAPAAVADQLAYDIALVRLIRHLGIECDVGDFDQPEHERARLEQALASRGVHLDQLDLRSESVPEGS